MTPTVALLLLLKIEVMIIIFGIGLDLVVADATYLLQRSRLLLRSLLAMYVLVPVAALILIKMTTPVPGVEAGLLVLAVSAGAPLLPRKLLGIGDSAYIFSLVVVSSLLAIVLVPSWLALLAPLFPHLPQLTVGRVAVVIANPSSPRSSWAWRFAGGCPRWRRRRPDAWSDWQGWHSR